jgi:hypothetical protein
LRLDCWITVHYFEVFLECALNCSTDHVN